MDYPVTREEAHNKLYGRSDGMYRPVPYISWRCAWEVSEPPYYTYKHQCKHKNGHGPGGLYCKQHAKRVEHLLELQEHDPS